MTAQQIKGIIKAKVHELSELGKEIDPGFDKKVIHDFRIAAKTLRALLRLLRRHTNEPGFELPRKFKRLYHISGTIREATLELEDLAEKKLQLPLYNRKLRNMIALQKKEWQKHHSYDIFRKLETKLCSLKIKELDAAVLQDFCGSRLISVALLVKNKPSENQLHSVRKKLKDIIYVSKLVKKNWKAEKAQTRKIPVGKLNKLTAAIGNYHDGRVSLEHLSAFTAPAISEAEELAIRSICDESASLLLEEKERIVGLIKDFVGEKQKLTA